MKNVIVLIALLISGSATLKAQQVSCEKVAYTSSSIEGNAFWYVYNNTDKTVEVTIELRRVVGNNCISGSKLTITKETITVGPNSRAKLSNAWKDENFCNGIDTSEYSLVGWKYL